MNHIWLFSALIVQWFIFLACLWAQERHGYKRGVRDANLAGNSRYLAGRRDADNWWIEAERQVEDERQKMWREGR